MCGFGHVLTKLGAAMTIRDRTSRKDGSLFMPNLHSLLRSQYIFLILGGISLCVGMVSTWTGVTWARFGRVIYRAKEPPSVLGGRRKRVILIGVCFIGYFLYKVYELSN